MVDKQSVKLSGIRFNTEVLLNSRSTFSSLVHGCVPLNCWSNLANCWMIKHLSICVSENLLNGDSPYPQMGPIGKVLPLPTPVEIAERTDGNGSDDDIGNSPVSSLDKRHAHTHTMSTRRVCWHRNTSISMTEHSLSVRVSILYF